MINGAICYDLNLFDIDFRNSQAFDINIKISLSYKKLFIKQHLQENKRK